MKYLLEPSEFGIQNPRIDGFKKMHEVNAKTIDIQIVTPDCFEYYKKNKSLPDEFVTSINKVIPEMVKKYEGYFLAVRRAFVVPGIVNPLGPRFHGAYTASEVTENVKSLFQFAIDNGYDKDKESQIAGFIHPFIGPEKFETGKDNSDKFLSYGGYAALENNGNVEIYAVYGENEGVQSLIADRYVISGDNGRFFIVRKEIPQKNKMLCPTESSAAELFNVPIEMQFEQIVSDSEILEVARVVKELSVKYGPQRAEFSVNKMGLGFIEIADYWKEEKTEEVRDMLISGTIKVINSLKDFQKIKTIPEKDLTSGKVVLKIGKKIVSSRNYDVLGALASWPTNLYVLYPGVAATQHAMRILTDKGHKAFLVGNQDFEENDKVQITVNGGKVRVTNLSRTDNQECISLWDASIAGVELCGGKAERLSKLKVLGFQVPHGASITTLVYKKVVNDLGYKVPVDIDNFDKIYKTLAKPSKKMTSYITDMLTDYIKSGKNYSVRSSATIEDDSKNSMAGMFDTFLNVTGNKIPEKIIAVIRSSFSPQIKDHLKLSNDLTDKLKMSVSVQEMVDARCAGVIFGAKVQTGDLDIVEIEANKGLGEDIVSGKAKNVEQYKFIRSERRIIERKGPEILSATEAKALFTLSERLRSDFNDVPQDIEWAIDKSGQIWILQSRDLYLGN